MIEFMSIVKGIQANKIDGCVDGRMDSKLVPRVLSLLPLLYRYEKTVVAAGHVPPRNSGFLIDVSQIV